MGIVETESKEPGSPYKQRVSELFFYTPNPKEVQDKIDAFQKTDSSIDENALNEILAMVEMEGFRKGLRTGIKLCCEMMDSERYA